ncbi:phosphatidylinositol mannoside acyltransferase [Vallicoccus soli]|uniref:phosphatidylinositol mannoside acyltransferase n=1 Tax=Vallicoccus soli TaxID=2339232 RepID=UPI001C498FA0|nr:phosphatidylinositol mannoside acyltransferase [Vallicoccus soli]
MSGRAYALGWSLVRRLPEPLAYGAFRLGADAFWLARPAPVRRLERTLARIVPGREREVARDAVRSYLRYWCDVFRLPDWAPERVVGRVRVEHEERLRAPLAEGRGVVAALGHLGNWDHAGAWAGLTGAPVTTVAERLEPPDLFERFVAFRRRIGIEVLPLDAPGLTGTLAARLAAGGLVPLLVDRDLAGTGVAVDLLGEQARFAPGPALLALRTGAALLPVTVHRDEDVLVLVLHPHVEPPRAGTTREKVVAMTQAVADAIGEGVRAHPEEWHVLQPVFAADLPGRP